MMATKIATDFLVRILAAVFAAVTPALRGMLEEFLTALAEKATQTENDLDDIFVQLLRDLLGYDTK